MKVAYFAPEFYPPWGGVGTYSMNLAREIGSYKDIEFHVFTPKRGKDWSEEKVLKLFDNKIKLHVISEANDQFFYNFKFQYALWKKFKEYNQKYNYDLVHAANLVHMPDIWLRIANDKTPAVATAQTTIMGQVKGFLQSNRNFFKMSQSEKMSLLGLPVIRFLEIQYLAKSKHIISASGKFVEELREQGYKNDVDVIHNGIDVSLFDRSKIQAPEKKFPWLKDINDPIVLYAGRIITQKGIEVLIRSMVKVLEKNKNVHFVFAGPGDIPGFYKLMEQYNIPKNKWTYAGTIPNNELPVLHKAADIFVLPSFYENFSLSLLEAMAMKTASIATDVGATSELVDNKNAILIKAGDSDVLAEKILFLLENPAKRRKIAELGRKTVFSNFSSKAMTKKTVAVYKKILK